MTVGSIAERAGVSKQTIYRWWKSKIDILLDVLKEDLQEEGGQEVDAQEEGAQEEDLQRAPQQPERRPASARAVLGDHVTHLSRMFTDSATGRVLFVLIGHALQDAATATVLRDQVLDRQRAHDRARLRKALASDSPRTLPRQEADRLLDLLAGPVFHRAFMTGRPMDPRFTARLVSTVLNGGQGVPSDAAPTAVTSP
ncbi:MAG: TetR/AcrR family transcriptional regulator [Streptomyces sp.]|nr:TetR/AcrR family transcriptional regulator [Streptomyces sp.]